ncbi:MAG: hypothetical protein EHM33_01090 [Chloroflexi bacterium]|nr:MAG: hypothetical protein EHM33_01090 [Chloroflexota bacterium]
MPTTDPVILLLQAPFAAVYLLALVSFIADRERERGKVATVDAAQYGLEPIDRMSREFIMRQL